MREPALMTRFLVFLMVSSSGLLMAQDLLEPLLVTASRSEQLAADVPYSTAYIGGDFLKDNDRHSIPKALQFTPGVLVQQTTYGHGSPFIRGFTGRRNLLMVDGIRMNNSTYRGGPIQYWNTVDPFSIDHMELIKGQGSVLYGPDAIGGTLNAITKSSNFRAEKEGEFFQHGLSSYEYRMNGNGSHIGRVESQMGIGGVFGLHFGISSKDFGDITDSSVGRMSGTGYDEEAFDIRADWAIDADTTLTFVSQYVDQDDINRWHSTVNNPGWTHGNHVTSAGTYESRVYDQERFLTYLRYSGSNPMVGAPIQRWNATLSYQTTADSERQERDDPTDAKNIRRRHVDLDTYGLDLTLETDNDHGTWIYGFDYYRDEVDSTGFNNNNAGTAYAEALSLADDSTYDLLGAFGQYIWRPSDQWEITGGARYTYAKATMGNSINESPNWDAFVGSLRALYRLDENWSVFGGASQAFRAPNLDDLTGAQTSKAGLTSLGSLNADPEEYITYELGLRRSSESLAFESSIFYTDISDQLVSVDQSSTDNTQKLVNGGDGYIYGVEAEGIWNIDSEWSLRAFGAWQSGKTETPAYVGGPINDENPTRLLPLTGSVALRWTSPSEKYWVQGRVTGAATEDRLSSSQQNDDRQRIPTNGTPSYIVASLNAGWQVNESLGLTCGVENLTDEDYRIHGSGQNEPGLMGVFGIEYEW